MFPKPALGIFDENRVEIDGGQVADGLLDDPARKGVAAADFQHVLSPFEHPGDELVARQHEKHMPGVFLPHQVHHDPQGLDADSIAQFDAR